MGLAMKIATFWKGLLFGAIIMASWHSMPARAATVFVTNCQDSGPGSLRNTIATAADGDTVNVSAQTASCFRRISLTSGEIVVPQDDLTIDGRVNALNGAHLHGGMLSRIFNHRGSGTLTLRWLSFNQGRVRGNMAMGGCVLSEGHVDLSTSSFSECQVWAEGGTNPVAMGGAIHARSVTDRDGAFVDNGGFGVGSAGGSISTEGRVTLLRTRISSSGAYDAGAILSTGGATITYSLIRDGFALHNSAAMQVSGGSVTINKSTIVNNYAEHRCGGVCVYGPGRTSIIDSTVIHNSAVYLAAGELSDQGEIFNSTIALNIDRTQHECVGAIRGRKLHIESSLIANNRCLAEDETLQAYDVGGRPWEGYAIVGANNLIRYSLVPVPSDTISADPRLGSQLNGWPHPLITLLPDSPAINRGNNANNRQYDQRGPGYPRVVGGRADIGAFEVQESL
jgi:hypothetical protein